MKSTRSPTEFDQKNRDVTSIPVVEPSTDLLKDKRCTTKRNRCLKRPDRESTEAIQRYFHDDTETKNTKSHCQPKGGKNTSKCCTTRSPWRSTSTSPQQLKEFKIRNIGFLRQRQMQKEELSNHSINDPTLLKRKKKRMQTIARRAPGKKEHGDIPRNQQIRQREGQQFGGNDEKDNHLRATKNTTSQLTRKQVAGSTKGRQQTCRQLRQDRGPTCKQLLSSSSTLDQTQWKTSNWNSEHSSSPDDW